MRKFRRLRVLGKSLLVFVFLLMLRDGLANTYYVSPKGNDALDGESPSTAWQTLQHVNQVINKLVSGDSILFQRGGIFSGTLQIVSEGAVIKDIYVGAYGKGANPVVSGAIEITNWRPFKGNIWMADWPHHVNAPSDLFFDGRQQKLGRYPNAGYNTITNVAGTKVFQDSTLTHIDGLWNGAEVVVRCNRWILNKLHVSKYNQREFSLDSTSSYAIKPGNGYFLQNHLATLDQPGEWFFDSVQHTIYLVLSPDAQPNEHQLTASVLNKGIVIRNASGITLENLLVEFYKQAAVEMVSADKTLLHKCTISFSGDIGLRVINCSSPSFAENTITDIHNIGVRWTNVSDGSFIANNIKNIGMIPGRGQSGDGSYIGLFITANTTLPGRHVIQYNNVDCTGYSAIDFRQGNTLIKNNVVRNFCLVKDDGAGIYTWHNTYGENSIEENIIVYNDTTTAWTSRSLISGIYIDDLSSDILVKKNTVAYCPTAGIYLHNASHIHIVENRLFGNGTNLLEDEKGQLYLKYDMPSDASNLAGPELVIYKNFLTSTCETTPCIFLSSDFTHDCNKIGKMNFNIYEAQNSAQAVAEFHGLQTICDAAQLYDLTRWQRESGLDSSSVFHRIPASDDGSSANSLPINGAFSINEDGWATWPSLAKHAIDLNAFSGNPSLRASVLVDHPGALLYYNSVPLKREKVYRLFFTAIASRPGNVQFAALTTDAPWKTISKYICFGVDKESRTYSCYFQVTEDCDQARLNFKFRNTLWIDNASVQEIHPSQNSTITLLYNATMVPVYISAGHRITNNKNLVELLPFSSTVVSRLPQKN